jgi:hypothetical protein
LSARGVPTRIGSRSGEPPFDRDDLITWGPALQNMESAYIVYYPDLAVPGGRAANGFFADLAVQSGVRRLVLSSGRGEEEALLSEQALLYPFHPGMPADIGVPLSSEPKRTLKSVRANLAPWKRR